jgi:hypothetical protein
MSGILPWAIDSKQEQEGINDESNEENLVRNGSMSLFRSYAVI